MEATEEAAAAIGVDATEEKTIAATQVDASAWGRHVQHQPFRWFEATKDEAAAAAIQVEPTGEEKTVAAIHVRIHAAKGKQAATRVETAQEGTTGAIQVEATIEGTT